MDEQRVDSSRIVVMARPSLSRTIAETLRAAGYEVHRTPGDDNLAGLVSRLQARLAIVALDLPWLDAAAVVSPLLAERPRVPVLLLGETGGDGRVDRVPRLPLSVDAGRLLEVMQDLLAQSDP